MLQRVPFNPDELKNPGTHAPARPGAAPARKLNTPITPKENYDAVYRKGDMPLWVPLGADRRSFMPRIDPDHIARNWVFEVNPLTDAELESLATKGYKDKHDIDWIYVPVTGGSIVRPGSPALLNANDWPKVIKMPDVSKWDWAGSAAANKDFLANDTRQLYVWIFTGFFERLISFMDFEGAAMALIDEDQQDAVKALFDKLADVYVDMVKLYKKYFNPHIVCVHDDWGHQINPFFGLDTVMEMIVPAFNKVGKAIHDEGMWFDIHSCGKNEILVPAYIAAGADSWSGQNMNDKAMLHQKYGDKIILGIETDVALTPQSSDEEAIGAAKRWLAKYGPTYDTKPAFCSAMAAPLSFADTLYEESRKLFSKG